MTDTEVDAPTTAADRDERSRWFLPALIVGWAIIGAALVGMVRDTSRTKPAELARYVLGFALVHDLIVVPLVLLVGWLLTRFVPSVARGPVRGALALSALVMIFAWPLLQRYGEHATNSSALPLDYRRTVPIVLAAIWAIALTIIAVRGVIAHRRSAA
jgi:hypothetical protein